MKARDTFVVIALYAPISLVANELQAVRATPSDTSVFTNILVNRDALIKGTLMVDDVNGISNLGNIIITGITKNGHTVSWPSEIGAQETFLASDGAGNLIYKTLPDSGNVNTAVSFTANNRIVTTDITNGETNIRQSGVTLDGANSISGVNTLTASHVNATLNGTSTGFTGALVGDVTGTQGTTVVSKVGGQTASAVASGIALTNAATNTNTANAIVKRDASGNFSAGTVTANVVGNVTGNVSGSAGSATTAINFTGSLVGDITGTQGATVVSRVSGQTASAVASGVTLANAATNVNTASAIVKRDASGNFSAGTVTANVVGNVTGNVSGSAGSAATATHFTGSLAGDVTGSQGATVVSKIGGQTASAVASGVTLANAATHVNTASALVKRDASGNFSAGTVTANIVGNVTGNVAGNLTGTADNAINFTGPLFGDVIGTQAATVVNSIGGQTAEAVAAGIDFINDATDANVASTLVARDEFGDFSAGTITANLVGNVTGNVLGTVASATSFTGELLGDITGIQSATVVSMVGGYAASAVAAGIDLVNTATAVDVASALVRRDNAGNFAAGTITADLIGDVVGNVTGLADSATTLIGSLVGDVIGTQGATVVSAVGGQAASAVAAGVTLVNTATAVNIAEALVRRDESGDFSANTITADIVGNVTGDIIGNLTGTADYATNFVGELVGDVTGTQGATAVSAVGGQTAAAVAASVVLVNAATDVNTAGALVKRDGSGNFSADTVTADLVGNVTGDVIGDLTGTADYATNFVGELVGDVTGTQGATTVSAVGGQTAAVIAAGVVLANAATDVNTASAIVKRDSSGNFSAGTIVGSLTGSASNNVLKAGDTMTGALQLPAGTATSPALRFTGSTTTGISAATANTLSFDTGGTERMSISDTEIKTLARFVLGGLICNQAVQSAAVTANNQVVNISSTTSVLILRPTGSFILPGITVNFPASPTNGQMCTILCQGNFSVNITLGGNGASVASAITNLQPGGLVFTATSGGSSASYMYDSTSNTWISYARG